MINNINNDMIQLHTYFEKDTCIITTDPISERAWKNWVYYLFRVLQNSFIHSLFVII